LNQFQGQTEAELLAWLRQILQNLVVDWVRHHTAEKRDVRREIELNEPVPDDDGTPSQIFRKKEEKERLTAAMKLLSDDHRIVIELRNRGLTFEEIGEQIGRTPDAARMLWGRAISRLVTLLEDNAR
jgi:RNA polymerase sigma-70 factor (ECF subfamily)